MVQIDASGELPVPQVKAWLDLTLPFWLVRGVDGPQGGFFEALSLDGTPLTTLPKRLRVQARQIYVSCHAALLGFSADALPAARAGYEFMTRHGWHQEGGWVHLFDPGGRVIDTKRDAYDHAFALLALSWFYRATGDGSALDWIERTLAFIDRDLVHPAGGFHESIPAEGPAPLRRQNPHMHLFEAMLSLHAATGDRQFLDRATRLCALFKERFFDAKRGILLEYFDADWKPLAGKNAVVEPGHHCEWVWLLDKFERLTGESTGTERQALLDFAMRHGRDPASGLLMDELNPDGTPRLTTMRAWPQCEGMKAKLASLERGELAAAADARHFAKGLLDRYLAVKPLGIWQDRFDAAGRGLTPQVPASTLYHVFLAFAELLRVAGAVPSGAADAVPLDLNGAA
jgi:mannose/cellobiose epimerase-like protein (N-acyl-D-glucosamine 2-epimerase family)